MSSQRMDVVLVTGIVWLLAAQALVFAAGALLAATAAALVAAFLNGVFGFCLGCEMYLLIRRFRAGRPPLAADR